jgi:hypothetical protein
MTLEGCIGRTAWSTKCYLRTNWAFISSGAEEKHGKLWSRCRVWGSHTDEYKGYSGMWRCIIRCKFKNFRRNILPPSSGSKSKPCKKLRVEWVVLPFCGLRPSSSSDTSINPPTGPLRIHGRIFRYFLLILTGSVYSQYSRYTYFINTSWGYCGMWSGWYRCLYADYNSAATKYRERDAYQSTRSVRLPRCLRGASLKLLFLKCGRHS